MNKTYVSISIIYYSASNLEPDVYYYRNDGVHPSTSTFNELSVDEANLLMWKLVKLGGTNTYQANRYDNTISERTATFWGEL